MTEQTTETQTETPPEGEAKPDAKTFDAEYVKKLRDEAAKYRTEAKANADAAKRLADIEQANKTEAQKQADQLADALKDAQAARAEALRFKIAAKFGVSDEDTELFLSGSDEETLTKQAQRLVERDAERKKQGNHVPGEGSKTNVTEGDGRTVARALFGGST